MKPNEYFLDEEECACTNLEVCRFHRADCFPLSPGEIAPTAGDCWTAREIETRGIKC